MIKEEFLIPEYYVNKVPMCDDCKVALKQEPYILMSNPAKYGYKCPKCNKEYYFFENELKGEWKWRTI